MGPVSDSTGKKLVPRRLPPKYKGLVSTDVNVQYDSAILREVVTVADTQVEYLAGTAIGTSAVTFTVDPPFGGTLLPKTPPSNGR